MGSSLSTCQLVSLFTPFLLHSSFGKTITYISLFFLYYFFYDFILSIIYTYRRHSSACPPRCAATGAAHRQRLLHIRKDRLRHISGNAHRRRGRHAQLCRGLPDNKNRDVCTIETYRACGRTHCRQTCSRICRNHFNSAPCYQTQSANGGRLSWGRSRNTCCKRKN